LVLSLVGGCATLAPKKFEKVSIGQWESRALVRDKKTNRSFIVYMTFIAENQSTPGGGRTRMDMTSSVGSQISSLLVEKGQATLLLLRDKKYYKGPSGSPRLAQVLNFPLDPKIFQNILFDTPVENKSWSCTRDKDGLLKDCKNAQSGIQFAVSERSGVKRNILITHPNGTAQISFTSFDDGPFDLEKVFSLLVPKSFSSI
jgi:hypothetical protein